MFDWFESAYDHIKSRLANPFLGALIFVWLLRNWLLIYSLFNFDENFGWKEKVEFINNYFHSKDFGYEIWTNIWIAFLLVVIGFITLLITRWITNIYEFKLLPLTYKYSEPKNLVTKERFDSLMKMSREKDDTIEKHRDALDRQELIIRNKESEIEVLTRRISEFQLKESKSITEISQDKDQNDFFAFTENQLDQRLKHYSEREVLIDHEKEKLKKVVFKIIEEQRLNEFLEIYNLLYKEGLEVRSIIRSTIDYYEKLEILVSKGIRQTTLGVTTTQGISITPLGKHVYKIFTDKTLNIIS